MSNEWHEGQNDRSNNGWLERGKVISPRLPRGPGGLLAMRYRGVRKKSGRCAPSPYATWAEKREDAKKIKVKLSKIRRVNSGQWSVGKSDAFTRSSSLSDDNAETPEGVTLTK